MEKSFYLKEKYVFKKYVNNCLFLKKTVIWNKKFFFNLFFFEKKILYLWRLKVQVSNQRIIYVPQINVHA